MEDVPHWIPTWQQAGVAAVCLAVVGRLVLARRPGSALAAAMTVETALVLALFSLWQLAGALAVVHSDDSVARGERVWHTERLLHLPSEVSLQHLALGHPLLVEFFNSYYIYAHFSSLIILLLWLFLRHPDSYGTARTVVALTTFGCLAIQLVPVAPPRMLTDHGIVDTGLAYGQSVYGPVGGGISDQFSAMPSVHVAWAVTVGLFTLTSSRSHWRWLGPAHTVLTVTVVVATGNHYWLDGIVAVAVLATALATARAAERLHRRWRPALRPAPALIEVP